MKISGTRFVIIFLASALAFQIITNSLLGPEVRLFSMHGEPFTDGSPVGWKSSAVTILDPLEYVLIGLLSSLFQLEDPPPPFLVPAFALYWSPFALILHYMTGKIIISKNIGASSGS